MFHPPYKRTHFDTYTQSTNRFQYLFSENNLHTEIIYKEENKFKNELKRVVFSNLD